MDYNIEQLKPYLFGLPWFGKEDYNLYRLPSSLHPKLSVDMQRLVKHTAGAVLRFHARTKMIAFELDRNPEPLFAGFSQVGQYGIDFYRDDHWMTNLMTRDHHQHVWVQCDESRVHEYAIYMPTYSPLEISTLALEAEYDGVPVDGPVLEPPTPFAVKGRVVVYGSSITQGAFASRSGLAYPARLGRMLDAEVVNLGFAGAGKGETEVANALADIPDVTLYIMDWGANLADLKEVNLIRDRYQYLVKQITSAHPTTPILFISPQTFLGESTDPNWAKSFKIIRETVKNNFDIARGKNVPCAYIDGREFITVNDMDCCVDGAHCNDLGFDRYIQAIVPVVKKLIKKID